MSDHTKVSARALCPHRLLAATLLAVAAAAILAAAPRAAVIGVNEDETKTNTSLYAQIASAGLKQNVLSVTWQQGSGLSSGQQTVIRSAISAGQAQGVKIVLAIYPAVGQAARFGDPANKAEFIAFVTNTLRSFPQVKDVVIGNEPNRTLFMSPVNPAYFAVLLGDAYDAVKAVDPSIKVLGAGLSPRGSGDGKSLFPPQFIKGMGDWYRTSERAKAGKPLMDTFSYHPYPFPENKAPDKPSDWPTIGMADLDRLKQALHDAFVGTPQKTPANGLTIDLDELAYQVPTADKPGYSDPETVRTVDEATQANYYAQIINQVACDPVISSLSFFHFVDEGPRGRFQSGFLDRQRNARPVLAAVKDAIAATSGGTKCNGTPNAWKPTTGIFGGIIDLSAVPATAPKTLSSLKARIRVEENVKATIGLFRIGRSKPTAADTADIQKLLALGTSTRSLVKQVEIWNRNIAAGAITSPTQRAELPIELDALSDGTHVLGVLLVSENAPGRTLVSLSSPIAIGTVVAETPQIVIITGSRASIDGKPGVKVTGETTALPAGTVLNAWVRFPGETAYTKGLTTITVAEDDTFSWTRKTGKKVYVYLTTADGAVKSNRIIIAVS